jgi:hypothetical protein
LIPSWLEIVDPIDEPPHPQMRDGLGYRATLDFRGLIRDMGHEDST